MDLKHILAATDFSETAGKAVARAALLARQHGARLHLIHVIPAISWKMFGRALVEHPLITEKHLYDAARAQLQSLAEDCQRRSGVEADCFVDVGRAHERIAAYAQQCQADLTVLGPHDENFARDLFVGSTARKLLHRDRQPTLVVRGAVETPYRRLLVAVDFTDASKRALEAALRLAPEAEVVAMHVYEVLFEGKMRYAGVEQNVIEQYRKAAATEAAGEMQNFLGTSQAGGRVQAVLRNGSPGLALLDEAQALQADLMVMGKHGRSDLGELFLGSVTEHVLYELDRDLLLV